MATNKDRAERGIRSAEREFTNAVRSLEEGDHAGALKYFQECSAYAVKAVLMAYGMDYPKVHTVGRFLSEIKEKYPKWFLKEIPDIADVTDSLARGRPNFRYPYERPTEQFKTTAREICPMVEEVLESCRKLVRQLFG